MTGQPLPGVSTAGPGLTLPPPLLTLPPARRAFRILLEDEARAHFRRGRRSRLCFFPTWAGRRQNQRSLRELR